MKRQMTIFLIYLMSTVLTGCSSLNSEFECSMKPGIRCESLDQVNSRVDNGEIGQSNLKMTRMDVPVTNGNGATNYPLYKDSACLSQREPLRYGETVMRVWMAPYEDTSGNYHQESEVYSVVKPGHWIGQPPKQTDIEG